MMDAVVIGGGPAGSAAAIRLARTGRRVRLYEKSHFPRPKLCGGYLTPEILEDLDDLNVLTPLRRSGAVPLRRTVIASRRGTLIESSLDKDALSITRDNLDSLLLEEARRAGADVREGTDGITRQEESPITVMATGRSDYLREGIRLRPWYVRPEISYFGIQALFQNVHGITDQVELDLIESGYVGLAPQINGTNVCTLTRQKTIERWGPDLDKVMSHFMKENPILQAHMKEAVRVGDWRAVGPVRLGIRRLAQDKTFYVGDAACVVDPFAGEGMAIGIYSSRLLVEALTQKDIAADQAYASLWKKAFLSPLRWNAVMQELSALSIIREPLMHLLGWFPNGMNPLIDLTRYRQLETL